MRDVQREWKRQGLKVAFVPTMGALHDGHLALVDYAKKNADRVVVSIFVNPLQFGPKEDFASYPRMLDEDKAKLESRQVDVLFAPTAAEMYPEGYQTYVFNNEMSNILCGKFRPGHFQVVLTVVAKLFHIVNPDLSIFGKKDYQQFKLISKMVEDLMFDMELHGAETLREKDGLAMSSRNLRLTPEERKLAPNLFQAMKSLRAKVIEGENSIPALLRSFSAEMSDTPEIKLEYVEIRDRMYLSDLGEVISKPSVLLVAAHLGTVRLIDNLEL
jgi:pantoate--beta-alanine ligase